MGLQAGGRRKMVNAQIYITTFRDKQTFDFFMRKSQQRKVVKLTLELGARSRVGLLSASAYSCVFSKEAKPVGL